MLGICYTCMICSSMPDLPTTVGYVVRIGNEGSVVVQVQIGLCIRVCYLLQQLIKYALVRSKWNDVTCCRGKYPMSIVCRSFLYDQTAGVAHSVRSVWRRIPSGVRKRFGRSVAVDELLKNKKQSSQLSTKLTVEYWQFLQLVTFLLPMQIVFSLLWWTFCFTRNDQIVPINIGDGN